MDELADLIVFITTSEFIYITEGGDFDLELDLLNSRIPVCAAEFTMDTPLFLTKEYYQRVYHILTKEVQCVDINSNLRTVFIGKDRNDETTGLVIFNSYNETKHTNAFFDRWDETQALIFEYTMKNQFGKMIACARGYWLNEAWLKIGIAPNPAISFQKPEE